MADAVQLIVDADVAGLQARLVFNDAWEEIVDGAERTRFAARLGSWAQPGPNRLVVQWRPLAAPSAAPPVLMVQLRKATPAASETLARFERTAEAPTTGATQLDIAFEPVQHWAWLDAERRAALTPDDRAEITALMRRLYDALVARSVPALTDLLRHSISEQAVAHGGTPEDMIADFEESMGERMDERWQVRPVDPNALAMTPKGEGRLVHVTGAGGAPALAAMSGRGPWFLSPYVARIGGVWQIVR
ncbi:hypothetical protein [Sphingomonas jatrophae]|uniref:Uncharacterized protein n=1 Tax=Sphingomonas jatrophae TaxID=1166337 RepID=A0A1I6JHW0_9SPHN|nr:hypothetical protein [Sphingomonas jatrophae]SFR78501.1 hypothetical protein SAMN05192580_0288 [Sphingomonas jatrophae]